VADWSGQEWELYLENLPTDVEASQVWILTDAISQYSVCLKATLLFVTTEFINLEYGGGCHSMDC
jgi:hypothetical protein